METETCSSEPQLQRPDKSRDDDRDNIAKTSWQDVRGECSGRQWGMCTIGCMYREQVDGPGGYDDTAMAVEQPSRASEVQQQQSTSPRRSRSRSACWYAKRARAAAEGGRHRDRDAQQHVQAGWLTGKMYREGRATYREGPSQTDSAAPLLAAVGRAPGVTSQGCAHRACLYLTYSSCRASLLYLNGTWVGVDVAAAMRAQPASGSRWRNPAPGSQTASDEW
jgi:hypothetical protein